MHIDIYLYICICICMYVYKYRYAHTLNTYVYIHICTYVIMNTPTVSVNDQITTCKHQPSTSKAAKVVARPSRHGGQLKRHPAPDAPFVLRHSQQPKKVPVRNFRGPWAAASHEVQNSSFGLHLNTIVSSVCIIKMTFSKCSGARSASRRDTRP